MNKENDVISINLKKLNEEYDYLDKLYNKEKELKK